MELCCPKINGIQNSLMELKKTFFFQRELTKLKKSKNPTLIKLLIF